MRWKYGEIVTAFGGAYSSKPRPVLIIQNPKFATGSSVIIMPFTSMQNEDITTRITVEPSKLNGLDRDCFVEVDKISAIKVSAIGPSIGQLEAGKLAEVTAWAVSLISPGEDEVR